MRSGGSTSPPTTRHLGARLHQPTPDTFTGEPAGRTSRERVGIPNFPVAPAADIAATYWQLHNDRRDSEFIFTAS